MLVALVALAPGAFAREARVDVDVDVEADLTVVARAVPRDADVDVEWDWGDGEATAGASARHAYVEPGRYEIVARFEDRDTGRCWTERRWVVVEVAEDEDEAHERDEREDEEERDEEDRSSRRTRSARASVSVGGGDGLSVRASMGRDGDDAQERDGDARGSASVRSSSYGSDRRHHEVPSVGLAALVPAVGGLALALRRR